MSPKVVGDAPGTVGVDNRMMAFLTRGTPAMTRYCYEGTDTPRQGFVQIGRDELSDLHSRSQQRLKVEKWLKDVQAPVVNYPPNYDEADRPKPPEYPDPWHSMRPPRYREDLPRLDPPTQQQLNPPLIRTDPVELPSHEDVPDIPKMHPVENRIKSMEKERNPVTPPNWGAQQYEALAVAYLKWKEEHRADGPEAADRPPVRDTSPNAYHPVEVMGKSWHIPRFTFQPNPPTPNNSFPYPAPPINSVLISHSLLSNAQHGPQWAVSLYVLEEFHSLRTGVAPVTQTPSLPGTPSRSNSHNFIGIERYLRPLCEAQGRQYTTSLYNRFRIAYAVFVGIMRYIEKMKDVEMEEEKARGVTADIARLL